MYDTSRGMIKETVDQEKSARLGEGLKIMKIRKEMSQELKHTIFTKSYLCDTMLWSVEGHQYTFHLRRIQSYCTVVTSSTKQAWND